MAAALQIYYSGFDSVFFKLSSEIRSRVEGKIDEMGLRLATFPHHRLKGQDRYRLRVGDYRVIYTFETEKNVIHLLSIGNRRQSARDLQRALIPRRRASTASMRFSN